MIVERKLFNSPEKMLAQDTFLSVQGDVVLTRIGNVNINVSVARDSSSIENWRNNVLTSQSDTSYSEIPLDDGRTLLIAAPKKVQLYDFNNMHRESPQSQAGYLARYEEPGKNLFLVQYLEGTSSRHLHPFSSEAFTVIDGDYFIHDETRNHTFKVKDISTNWVTQRPIGSDHQCFNYGKPAIAIVHLTGPDFHHKHMPMRNISYLHSMAEKILARE